MSNTDTNLPVPSNILIAERAMPDDVAFGVGIYKIDECNPYEYVPMLDDVVLPTVVVIMRGDTRDGRDQIVAHKLFTYSQREDLFYYRAKTDIWDPSKNGGTAWLEYSIDGVDWSSNGVYAMGEIGDRITVRVMAKYQHRNGDVLIVARRIVYVSIIDEIYTIEYDPITTTWEYLDALEDLTPEEVQTLDFFQRHTTDNVVRLDANGAVDYYLHRPSLATKFPLGRHVKDQRIDFYGLHKPFANDLLVNNKIGNIMLEHPLFYYQWGKSEQFATACCLQMENVAPSTMISGVTFLIKSNKEDEEQEEIHKEDKLIDAEFEFECEENVNPIETRDRIYTIAFNSTRADRLDTLGVLPIYAVTHDIMPCGKEVGSVRFAYEEANPQEGKQSQLYASFQLKSMAATPEWRITCQELLDLADWSQSGSGYNFAHEYTADKCGRTHPGKPEHHLYDPIKTSNIFGYPWRPCDLEFGKPPEEEVEAKIPVKIDAGQHHVAVLLADGTLWTAGDNTLYQLGRSTKRYLLFIDEYDTTKHPEPPRGIPTTPNNFKITSHVIESDNKERKIPIKMKGELTFVWDAVTNITEYEIRYRQGEGMWTLVPHILPNNRIWSLAIRRLTAGTDYTFQVRARLEVPSQTEEEDEIRVSEWSHPVTIHISEGFNPYPNNFGLVGDGGDPEYGGGVSLYYYNSPYITSPSDPGQDRVVDVSCGFNHMVFVVENTKIEVKETANGSEEHIKKTRRIYSCGANDFGQLGREPYERRVLIGLVEIPGDLTWHDGTPYNNDDNTRKFIRGTGFVSNDALNKDRFAIRKEECLYVECGSYHSHFIYPIGTISYSEGVDAASEGDEVIHHQIRDWRTEKTAEPLIEQYEWLIEEIARLKALKRSTGHLEDQLDRVKVQLDQLGWGYKWPAVMVNCGRNFHGELCRGESNEIVNPLKATILGGTHTRTEKDEEDNILVAGGRLYPDIVSSGVYHTVFTVEDIVVEEKIAQEPEDCENGQIFDQLAQVCVPDPELEGAVCNERVLRVQEKELYTIHLVFYYDNMITPGHSCNRGAWNIELKTATEEKTAQISTNNFGRCDRGRPAGSQDMRDRYAGDLMATLSREDIKTSMDCIITLTMKYDFDGCNDTSDPHQDIDRFDVAIHNTKDNKWFHARALYIIPNPQNRHEKELALIISPELDFPYDTFVNYRTNASNNPRVQVNNSHGEVVTVFAWTQCFIGHEAGQDKVFSCGTNRYGQLGRISEDWFDPKIEKVSIEHELSRIETGWGGTAFVDRKNNLYTCGANYHGQLGRVGSSGTPETVNLLGNNVKVKDVKMGYLHMLYIAMNDIVWSCGKSDYGVLLVNGGSGDEATSNLRNTNFKANVIGTGESYSGFAELSDNTKHHGRLWCAGNNEKGILGRIELSNIDEHGQIIKDVTNVGVTDFLDMSDEYDDEYDEMSCCFVMLNMLPTSILRGNTFTIRNLQYRTTFTTLRAGDITLRTPPVDIVLVSDPTKKIGSVKFAYHRKDQRVFAIITLFKFMFNPELAIDCSDLWKTRGIFGHSWLQCWDLVLCGEPGVKITHEPPRFSLVRAVKPCVEPWYLWDTFHVWNGRLVDNLYTSLFPATIHKTNRTPSLIAGSHFVPDDLTTADIDEANPIATPEDARKSVSNVGTKYRVLSYEHVTMLRMLALMLYKDSEDISQFFGSGELTDKAMRSPVFVDGIRIDKKTTITNRGEEDEEITETLAVRLTDIYTHDGYMEEVIEYTPEEIEQKNINLYHGTNKTKMLPREFGEERTKSSIDMAQVGQPPTNTRLMSMTLADGTFDLKQMLPTEELPFYFVAYGRGHGQTMDIYSRYWNDQVSINNQNVTGNMVIKVQDGEY